MQRLCTCSSEGEFKTFDRTLQSSHKFETRSTKFIPFQKHVLRYPSVPDPADHRPNNKSHHRTAMLRNRLCEQLNLLAPELFS